MIVTWSFITIRVMCWKYYQFSGGCAFGFVSMCQQNYMQYMCINIDTKHLSIVAIWTVAWSVAMNNVVCGRDQCYNKPNLDLLLLLYCMIIIGYSKHNTWTMWLTIVWCKRMKIEVQLLLCDAFQQFSSVIVACT